MIVKKRKSTMVTRWCSNGCRFSSNMPKEASHVAEVLGHDVFLCKLCARDWPDLWDSAIHPASWERTLCRKEVA